MLCVKRIWIKKTQNSGHNFLLLNTTYPQVMYNLGISGILGDISKLSLGDKWIFTLPHAYEYRTHTFLLFLTSILDTHPSTILHATKCLARIRFRVILIIKIKQKNRNWPMKQHNNHTGNYFVVNLSVGWSPIQTVSCNEYRNYQLMYILWTNTTNLTNNKYRNYQLMCIFWTNTMLIRWRAYFA